VPFHSDMNYARTADHFISKGKCAERELFSLFYRANIHNLDSRLALFESLVKSVVMYCYHIWGVNFIEKLKRFSMGFLRRLFRLSIYTPRWFLLLESSCKRIELCLVKNILSFWLKIMQKPRDSLMYYCYDFLLSRKEHKRMKFNWCRDVMVVLEDYECISLVEEEIDVLINHNALYLNVVSKCLTDINNKYTQAVIQDKQKSSKNPFYQISRSHCKPDAIFNSNTNWNLISLYVQIKAFIPRIKHKSRTISFNAMNSYFCRDEFCEIDLCSLCSTQKAETFFHVMFECSAYSNVRNFSNTFSPISEEDLFNKCIDVTRELLMLIYGYVGKMIEIRDQWYNDYS
jgi:hypothetical protein